MFRRPYFKGFTQKWQYRAQYVCRPLHVRLLKETCMQNNKSEIFQTAFISDGLRHKKRGNPEGLPEIPQIRDLRFTNNTGSRLSLSARLNSMQTKVVGFRRPCNH